MWQSFWFPVPSEKKKDLGFGGSLRSRAPPRNMAYSKGWLTIGFLDKAKINLISGEGMLGVGVGWLAMNSRIGRANIKQKDKGVYSLQAALESQPQQHLSRYWIQKQHVSEKSSISRYKTNYKCQTYNAFRSTTIKLKQLTNIIERTY